jgi:hypothetical protein
MKWDEHVELVEEKRNAFRVLVGEPEKNKPLRRSMSR